MKEHLKTVSQKVTNYVDIDTGELVDTSVREHKILIEDKQEFALFYTKCINVLSKWDLNLSDLQLFAYLVLNYSGGQLFSVNKSIKTILAKQNNKSPSTYNNSTRNLLDKRLILPAEGKSYRLNPTYVWKGNEKNRKKVIIEILETCNNCL